MYSKHQNLEHNFQRWCHLCLHILHCKGEKKVFDPTTRYLDSTVIRHLSVHTINRVLVTLRYNLYSPCVACSIFWPSTYCTRVIWEAEKYDSYKIFLYFLSKSQILNCQRENEVRKFHINLTTHRTTWKIGTEEKKCLIR